MIKVDMTNTDEVFGTRNVRRPLEPEATALAVDRLTDDDLAELRSLLKHAHALVQSPAMDHEELMATTGRSTI